MSLDSLRNGQSFTVREVKSGISKAELLKSIENNGLADIVLEEKGKTFVVSGEKIDISEFGKMLKGSIPETERIKKLEFSDLYIFLCDTDSDDDNKISEKELKWTGGKVASKAGETISNNAAIGADFGAEYGGIIGSNIDIVLDERLGFDPGSTVECLGAVAGIVSMSLLGLAKGVVVASVSAGIDATKIGDYHTKKDYQDSYGRVKTIR